MHVVSRTPGLSASWALGAAFHLAVVHIKQTGFVAVAWICHGTRMAMIDALSPRGKRPVCEKACSFATLIKVNAVSSLSRQRFESEYETVETVIQSPEQD